MGLGEKLKNERLKKNIELKAVEEETKIRRLYLEAIENENFDLLPPRVYTIGFVKKYAKYLGLDEKELVEEFKEKAYSGQVQEEEIVHVNSEGLNISIKNVVPAILFLVIAIWIGNYLIGFFSEAIKDNNNLDKSPGVEMQQPAENQDKGESEETTDEEVGYVSEKVVLKLKARNNCWLKAMVDGETVFEEVLPAGQERLLEGDTAIAITVGNAGGIDIIYNGQEIEALGGYGEVKYKEFIVEDSTE